MPQHARDTTNVFVSMKYAKKDREKNGYRIRTDPPSDIVYNAKNPCADTDDAGNAPCCFILILMTILAHAESIIQPLIMAFSVFYAKAIAMADIVNTRKNYKPNTNGWAELRRRCNTLKITHEEIKASGSLHNLKLLAKKKYRARVKSLHPDRTKGANAKRIIYSATYQKVVKSYKWILALDQKTFDRLNLSRHTVPDPELPIDWGMGWKEYDSRYDGYIVLPRL